MDFERGAEFATKDEPIQKESGYSEEEQAKVVEGALMDTKQPTKRAALSATLTMKEKILASYKRNLGKILQLVERISALEGKNYRQEEQIVEEIKGLRHIQEELLNALILEQKGNLTEKSISKEAWDLIQ